MTLTNLNATTPQLTLVKNYLDAYLTLDISKVAPFISKNYTFQTFPKTPDLPDEPKEGHFERFGPLLSNLSKAEGVVHEVIEAPGKVVLHATGTGYAADGNKFEYDSVTILTIGEEDGELKILGSKDFSDPQKRTNLHGWAEKARAKGGPVA